VFGGSLFAAAIAATVVGFISVEKVRIGGDMYGRIVQNQDLVADIIPPAAFVMETYLEATLALNRAKPIEDSTERLVDLRKIYEERRDFWSKSDLNDALKKKLTVESDAHVSKIWKVIDEELFPGIVNNNPYGASDAHAKITGLYLAHRRVIDGIVTEANKMSKEIEADSAVQGKVTFAVLSVMLAVLFGIIIAGIWIMSRRVVGPVEKMTAVMKSLADGELHLEIPFAQRDDEVGQMARALQVFRDAALQKIELEAEAEKQRNEAESLSRLSAEEQARVHAERALISEEQNRVMTSLADGLKNLADGNLAFRMTEQFSDTYEQIRHDFNGALEQLSETISIISSAASEVTRAADEISAGSTELSSRVEDQSHRLEQTAASMEEIAVNVRKNAESVQQADRFAGNTRTIADGSGEIVAKAIKSMSLIEDSSNKITDIIVVIDEIARQTNLLALNAAVEAARAGDAGRGFAVVASEVRHLAQRSSEAAKNIKQLIDTSSGQVREGVALVNKAGDSLSQIVASIKEVAGVVADISGSSSEQTSAIDHVNKALSQLDEITQQNAALVEESSASARALAQQAQDMHQRVGVFQLSGEQAEIGRAA
jgi:methyl-accepting chemotaxis protein